MKYARIEDGRVAEVIEPFTDYTGKVVPIEERFSADLVATMLPCAEDVAPGYLVNDAGEFAPPPVPESPDLAAVIRAQRDTLLAASDWTQLRDVPESVAVPWAAYRQEVRNVPQQSGFPDSVNWPVPPNLSEPDGNS